MYQYILHSTNELFFIIKGLIDSYKLCYHEFFIAILHSVLSNLRKISMWQFHLCFKCQ